MTSLVSEQDKHRRRAHSSSYGFSVDLGHMSNRTTPSPMLYTSSASSGKRSPSTPPFHFPKHPRTESTPTSASSGNVHFPMNNSSYWSSNSHPQCAIDRDEKQSKPIFLINFVQRWSFIWRESGTSTTVFIFCVQLKKRGENPYLNAQPSTETSIIYSILTFIYEWPNENMFVRAFPFLSHLLSSTSRNQENTRTRAHKTFLFVSQCLLYETRSNTISVSITAVRFLLLVLLLRLLFAFIVFSFLFSCLWLCWIHVMWVGLIDHSSGTFSRHRRRSLWPEMKNIHQRTGSNL